jgi:hypothetical protein
VVTARAVDDVEPVPYTREPEAGRGGEDGGDGVTL